MDQDRFDALTKDLAGRRSRRGVLKGLAGAALGALAGVAGLEAAGANPPPKKCKYQGSNCNGNTDCCTLNCCNRTCCGDGQVCASGQCVFATSTTPAPTTTTTPAPTTTTTTTTPAPTTTTTTTPAPTTTTTTTPVPTSTTCTVGVDQFGQPGQYDQCLPAYGCKSGCTCINPSGDLGGVGYCDSCTKCDGSTCAALQTDVNNCGACGHVCQQGLTCSGSQCVCPQGATYAFCPEAGACFPLDKDPNNCGKCGNVCTGATSCQNYNCV